jgi:hypothetical protein
MDLKCVAMREWRRSPLITSRWRRERGDAPEIAEALALGKFASAAAARAAGFKVDRSPLALARRGWKRMSAEDRSTFLAEIGATLRP